jgi:hypothetical protein
MDALPGMQRHGRFGPKNGRPAMSKLDSGQIVKSRHPFFVVADNVSHLVGRQGIVMDVSAE